jgi:photosystem I subunit V
MSDILWTLYSSDAFCRYPRLPVLWTELSVLNAMFRAIASTVTRNGPGDSPEAEAETVTFTLLKIVQAWIPYPVPSNGHAPWAHHEILRLSATSLAFPRPHHICQVSTPLCTQTPLTTDSLARDQETPPPRTSPENTRPHNMATSTAAVLSPPSVAGLRLAPSPRARSSVSFRATPARRSVAARAELNPSLVISLSTGVSLFLGRFVFFNFQRENVAKQVPEQNGKTHFEAGDVRAKEYAGLLKSNDPVGFNLVDVLAWGSLGHIVAYYILATSSNGYDPNFF